MKSYNLEKMGLAGLSAHYIFLGPKIMAHYIYLIFRTDLDGIEWRLVWSYDHRADAVGMIQALAPVLPSLGWRVGRTIAFHD